MTVIKNNNFERLTLKKSITKRSKETLLIRNVLSIFLEALEVYKNQRYYLSIYLKSNGVGQKCSSLRSLGFEPNISSIRDVRGFKIAT